MYINKIIAICSLIATSIVSAGEIIPSGWLNPELLLQAERPIQEQLDTGKAMNSTAWDMAAVKDARLLTIYMELYQTLQRKNKQANLFADQNNWLESRKEAVKALNDPEGGSMVSLQQASTHMEFTDKRIAALQRELDGFEKAEVKGMLEMKKEAGEVFERVDIELNTVYKNVLKQLSPKGTEAIKAAQRAWITFRDKTAEAYGTSEEGGSLEGLLRSNCMIAITQNRISELKSLFLSGGYPY